MLDLVAYIVCILIVIACLLDMNFHFLSSRGYKILSVIGTGCVLILL